MFWLRNKEVNFEQCPSSKGLKNGMSSSNHVKPSHSHFTVSVLAIKSQQVYYNIIITWFLFNDLRDLFLCSINQVFCKKWMVVQQKLINGEK